MSTNYFQDGTGLLGCNLEGNEPPSTGTDGVIQIPRVQILSSVMINKGLSAIYLLAGSAINPGQTIQYDAAGTCNGTTGTVESIHNFRIALNIATTSTGDCMWARTSTNLAW